MGTPVSRRIEKAQFCREQEAQSRRTSSSMREKFDVKSSARRVVRRPGQIDEVVSKSTSMPLTSIDQDAGDKLLHMEDALHRRVVSRDKAVSALARAIRRSRARHEVAEPCGGRLHVLRPDHVGKTELTPALSETFCSAATTRSSASTCRRTWKSTRSRS